MPKIVISGRGGCGKSTLVTLLAQRLGEEGKVLVVDADESNLGLSAMFGVEPPEKTLMDYLGGKPVVGKKLRAMIKSDGNEKVELFAEKMNLDSLPMECVRRKGPIVLLRIGKIEHSMEGCACPMGAVARNFLNYLTIEERQWVLVDTEAGIEHFGRGVIEGVDAILMVVDPSYEAILLAEKAARLSQEVKKDFGVVLNKVDEKTEPILKEKLAEKGVVIKGVLPYSADIAQANLLGGALKLGTVREELDRIVSGIK
ncbi:CO dehydrogenase maturation factor [Thermoanaerobacter kivui]|uniref:CO dehydrogenase maturation factor n=1 Tax=Thermoanaerobacter kivui TaxID=2325 RepID=A0A097AQX1_THEKI|nr:AAA family ATPase [Thermoanaerobacter kivui]AIS52212.1 CO dehydrogenase maturation factor [Thermoanaerobacter kivui]